MKILSSILTKCGYQTTSCFLRRSISLKPSWNQPSGDDTGISIYNCILEKKVPLVLNNNTGSWYSCGPTVYDSAHIGHASCYVKLDIIQRILINYFNINLVTSMGITDIDDKIIERSIAKNISWNTLTQNYEAEFWKDMSDLNVLPPDFILRVSDNISTITSFIKGIESKKMCYTTSDKSVYFNTEVYGNYGKLQKAQLTESEKKTEKKSPADFALWKAHKVGEPYWETEWGNGRPGWHIECSAMVSRLFGRTVDFHAGGIDLQFPHHENEEAQSCAFHNCDQWVNYWIHTGHLHLHKDAKMSKSLKNTINIDELLKTYSADTFRMACLMSHYRYQMEFSEKIMTNAKVIIEKIKYFIKECDDYSNNPITVHTNDADKLIALLNDTKVSIDKCLRDDFDTSKCITLLNKLMKETNQIIKPEAQQSTVDMITLNPVVVMLIKKYVDRVMTDFGISFNRTKTDNVKGFSEIVDSAVQFRHAVRARAIETKDKLLLNECDNLRNMLKSNKIHVNDKSSSHSLWILKE